MHGAKTAAYPGEGATAHDLRQLADEYRRAAMLVAASGRRGFPLSRSPCRLLAVHAVELYLSAYLLRAGHDSKDVRRLQHDLAARTDLALAAGLVLRQRTAAHLHALHEAREYLVHRYAPERAATASPINRLAATLEEVARRTAPEEERRGPPSRIEDRRPSGSARSLR